MDATLRTIGMKLARGACAAVLATAAVACGGTLRVDEGHGLYRGADSSAALATDVGTPLDEDGIQDRATRAALSRGRDYVDAIADGRAAVAAARHAAARAAAADVGVGPTAAAP